MLNVLDLFSGIGAFSLGLERSGGFRTVAFCEIDPFRRAVLAKHWPGVPCYPDVCELTAKRLRADDIAVVDLVCGGFPCQDVSVAGTGLGLDGERSGLWREMRRIIGELRPRFALVENTAALTGRGLHRILGDFAEIGMHAEWHTIPAAAVGAPHLRDRTWIIAWLPDADGGSIRHQSGRRDGPHWSDPSVAGDDGSPRSVADADVEGLRREREPQHRNVEGASGRELDGCDPGGRRARAALADADDDGRDQRSGSCGIGAGRIADGGSALVHTGEARRGELGEGDARSGEQGARPGADRAARGAGRDGGAALVGLAGGARLPIGPRTFAEWAFAATAGANRRQSESRLGRASHGPAEGLDPIGWGPGWEDGVSRTVETQADKVNRRARIAAIGDSLVPDIPEILGRAIMRMAG